MGGGGSQTIKNEMNFKSTTKILEENITENAPITKGLTNPGTNLLQNSKDSSTDTEHTEDASIETS